MFENIANFFKSDEKPNLGKIPNGRKKYIEIEDLPDHDGRSPDEILMAREEGGEEQLPPFAIEPVVDTTESVEKKSGNYNFDGNPDDVKHSGNSRFEESNFREGETEINEREYVSSVPRTERILSRDPWSDYPTSESHRSKPNRPKGSETIRGNLGQNQDIEKAA
jgi:hypothetical protein